MKINCVNVHIKDSKIELCAQFIKTKYRFLSVQVVLKSSRYSKIIHKIHLKKYNTSF